MDVAAVAVAVLSLRVAVAVVDVSPCVAFMALAACLAVRMAATAFPRRSTVRHLLISPALSPVGAIVVSSVIVSIVSQVSTRHKPRHWKDVARLSVRLPVRWRLSVAASVWDVFPDFSKTRGRVPQPATASASTASVTQEWKDL